MDVVTSVRITLLFLLEIYFVTSRKHLLANAASEKERFRSDRGLSQSGHASSRLLPSESIRRSINKDMGIISQILLPLKNDQEETNFNHRAVRSLRKNRLSNSLSTSSNVQRTLNITHSELLNANNLNEQVPLFKNPHSNNLLHHNNHRKHLHQKIFYEKQVQSRDQILCGSLNHSRVYLQLFKNWNISSCHFARSRLRHYPNHGCLTNCPAYQVPCCWLQNQHRRAKNRNSKQKSKRHAEKRTFTSLEAFKKDLAKNLGIQPTQETRHHSRRIPQSHDTNRLSKWDVGDTVIMPSDSVDGRKPLKKFVYPGIHIRKGGKYLCIYENGSIIPVGELLQLDLHLVNNIPITCYRSMDCKGQGAYTLKFWKGVVRRLNVFNNEDIAVHKLYGNITGLYVAMNKKHQLYTTKRADDPKTDFIHKRKFGVDAFESRPYRSYYVAFKKNGKPYRKKIDVNSSILLHHLFEQDLEKLFEKKNKLLKKINSSKVKVRTTTTSVASITTGTPSSTSLETSSDLPSTEVATTTVNPSTSKLKCKHNHRKKDKKKKQRKKKKKGRRTKKIKSNRRKSNQIKQTNNKKRKTRRHKRSISYSNTDISNDLLQNNIPIKHTNYEINNSFFGKLLQLLKETSAKPKPPT